MIYILLLLLLLLTSISIQHYSCIYARECTFFFPTYSYAHYNPLNNLVEIIISKKKKKKNIEKDDDGLKLHTAM